MVTGHSGGDVIAFIDAIAHQIVLQEKGLKLKA
jgi:hypothetical protein